MDFRPVIEGSAFHRELQVIKQLQPTPRTVCRSTLPIRRSILWFAGTFGLSIGFAFSGWYLSAWWWYVPACISFATSCLAALLIRWGELEERREARLARTGIPVFAEASTTVDVSQFMDGRLVDAVVTFSYIPSASHVSQTPSPFGFTRKYALDCSNTINAPGRRLSTTTKRVDLKDGFDALLPPDKSNWLSPFNQRDQLHRIMEPLVVLYEPSNPREHVVPRHLSEHSYWV